jgi:GNAT superfamily N-acetyltransferase
MYLTQDDYVLTDDRGRLDIDAIMGLLAGSYWARNRSRSAMQKAIEHSICFGLFREKRQVGFARAVTDHATFAWVCDIIIHPEHQRKGLGTWMVKCLLEHPDLQTTTQVLRTKDAHSFYERFGFQRAEYMRRSSNPL